MGSYNKVYLNDVVESQGKLFDHVARSFPDKDTGDFIEAYMRSRTRESIDNQMAYVATMDHLALWDWWSRTEGLPMRDGKAMGGFLPEWIGEFYAWYQWRWGIPSKEVVQAVPVEYLKKAYAALHDLDLELAVEKVGAPVGRG